MSDNVTKDAPKVKRSGGSYKPTPFAQFKVKLASAAGIPDNKRDAFYKTLRGHIRSNADNPAIAALLKQSNKDNRDGNRYGNVPAVTAKHLMQWAKGRNGKSSK